MGAPIILNSRDKWLLANAVQNGMDMSCLCSGRLARDVHDLKKAFKGLTTYIDCFLKMSEGTYMYAGSMHIEYGVYVSGMVFVPAL
eukprot:s1377_g15.t1